VGLMVMLRFHKSLPFNLLYSVDVGIPNSCAVLLNVDLMFSGISAILSIFG